MANPSDSTVQNLLPVQAYFDAQNNFVTFIGQNQPFYAIPDPDQSGLHITNSTIDSSVIGGTTPAVGYFTSGYVSVAPTTATGIANKQYVDYFAAGLSWKQPVKAASLANIASLSGFQTIDAVPLTDGDRVLVKDQSLSKNNGIYVVRSGAWEYAIGADDWNEYVGAIVFVEEGSQAYSAWYCLAQEGGTLGVTALDWANFSVSSTYSAGTGLTLLAGVFSITNTGVTNGTYGSASRVVTQAVNAQGQLTSIFDQPIDIAATQIGSGTIDSARLSGSYSGITGLGTLGNLTVTNTIVGSISGNAATAGSATTATTATNIAGGAAGSLPYQSASGATSLLAAGTNGQVLTLASGIPSWATPTTGTVTSVSGTGTVNGLTLTGTVTSSGSLTLGGTLDLSSPPAIGGTTANAITGTTITAASYFISENYYGLPSVGGNLKTSAGTSLLNWDGGGSGNITFNTGFTANPANKNISISPTGTGTVAISPVGALTVNPTAASTMNNVAIGGTTPLAGTFTTLRVNSTISLAGSTGTSGYVMTSNGASAPTWSALPASTITVTDDTTTNATRYLTFTSATSGSITGENVSSTKLQFNPSTGVLGASGLALTNGNGLLNQTWTTAGRPATPVAGQTGYNTTLNVVEYYNGTAWQQIIVATGTSTYSVEYLIVAGGAGGGGRVGGGGGGGGVLNGFFTATSGTGYSLVIGAGGAGGGSGVVGVNGSDSTGFSLTAVGGGGGAGIGTAAGSGGSGGGSSYTSAAFGAGTAGQGFAGGCSYTINASYGGGGGGGAGQTGGQGSSLCGGNGGSGMLSRISGSYAYYAGGGGGGLSSVAGGTGGAGGGGAGGNNTTGTNGTANTGGGGGGGGDFASGGNGGSGIVIISYPGAQRATGGTVTSVNGYTIHTFTSSGTFTA